MYQSATLLKACKCFSGNHYLNFYSTGTENVCSTDATFSGVSVDFSYFGHFDAAKGRQTTLM